MKKFLLDIALAEYNSLNNQILTKTKMLYQIYLIYLGALGVFYGYIFNKEKYDFLLLVPWMSLALFFRLYYDQQIMDLMSKYVQEELVPKQLLPLVTDEPKEKLLETPVIIQWGRFYKIHQPSPYYKFSFWVIFVFLSIGPAFYYDVSIMPWRNLQICQFSWAPPFPPINHLLFALFNIAIGFWITYLIWKIDPNLRNRGKK